MKIIITHQNADFDGLGAMLAARKLWPDHHMVLSSAISQPVRKYMALHRDWLTVKQPPELEGEEITEVIVVDSRDESRFKDFSEILKNASRVTIFDHHPPGERDMEATTLIVEPVGACTTLLCERIEEKGIELDPEEATLMMLGLYADTGNLSFPSTTVRDLRAAAFLRESGASLPVVNRYLQQQYTPQQQELLVAILGGIELTERQGLRIGCGSHHTRSYVKGAALVVERILQLLGLDACFAILQVEGKDTVQIIGRSQTRHVDAAAIAQLWEGGGHPSAASARTREESREEVFEKLKQYISNAEIAPLEVSDVMSSPVQCVDSDTTLEVLQPLLQKWGVRGVPVMKDGKLVGIVSQRDMKKAVQREDWSVPVAGFMTHAVITVEPNQSLNEALELMTEEDIGRLPVVRGGEVLGIVSRTDILERLYANGGNDLASS